MGRLALRLVALLALAAAGAAPAQTMYRCGKTFQDRPCEDGQPGQRIITGSSPSPQASNGAAPAPVSRFTAECSRRGEQVFKIVWQREAGATMDRQLGEAKGNAALSELIQDVYSRRGTAPEVRAAIEQDCVAGRERAAQAAAVLQMLQQQAQGSRSGATAAAPAPSASAPEQRPAAAPTPRPDSRCSSYAARRQTIDDQLRTGGNIQVMESLRRSRAEVERLQSAAGC